VNPIIYEICKSISGLTCISRFTSYSVQVQVSFIQLYILTVALDIRLIRETRLLAELVEIHMLAVRREPYFVIFCLLQLWLLRCFPLCYVLVLFLVNSGPHFIHKTSVIGTSSDTPTVLLFFVRFILTFISDQSCNAHVFREHLFVQLAYDTLLDRRREDHGEEILRQLVHQMCDPPVLVETHGVRAQWYQGRAITS